MKISNNLSKYSQATNRVQANNCGQNNIVRSKEGTRYTIKANKKEKYSNCVCAFGVSVILLQGLLDIKGKETSVKKVTMTLKTNNNAT